MRTTHIPPPSRRPGERAFSLIEVVLAIGIVAFALVTVIALLPVGLGSMKHAREQAAGAACVSQIAQSPWTPVSTGSSGNNAYQASGVWANAISTWPATSATNTYFGTGSSSSAATVPDPTISLAGIPTAVTLDQRLVAHIQIQPPVTNASTGTALISVAWPANTAKWDAVNSKWTNVDGSISSWVVLLPPPPQ